MPPTPDPERERIHLPRVEMRTTVIPNLRRFPRMGRCYLDQAPRSAEALAQPQGIGDGPGASCFQAGVNIGMLQPSAAGLKHSFTRWPILSASRSQSTMLVSIVTPSSSRT